jgi:hypothetical protein
MRNTSSQEEHALKAAMNLGVSRLRVAGMLVHRLKEEM